MTSVLAQQLTEKQLSDNIVNLARMLGWLVHRDPTWRATGTDPGYPDLTLVSPMGRVVFMELKSQYGKATESQIEWHRRLKQARGVTCHLIRPSDWYAGKVERILG